MSFILLQRRVCDGCTTLMGHEQKNISCINPVCYNEGLDPDASAHQIQKHFIKNSALAFYDPQHENKKEVSYEETNSTIRHVIQPHFFLASKSLFGWDWHSIKNSDPDKKYLYIERKPSDHSIEELVILGKFQDMTYDEVLRKIDMCTNYFNVRLGGGHCF